MTASNRLTKYAQLFDKSAKVVFVREKGVNGYFSLVTDQYKFGINIGHSEGESKLSLAESYGDQLYLRQWQKGLENCDLMKNYREKYESN